MEDNKSFLKLNRIPISPGITLKIPKVGDVLENEKSYYNLVLTLTASPFTCMVKLDGMGIDYTKIDDWELFKIQFLDLTNQVIIYKSKIKELSIILDTLSPKSNEYIQCESQIRFLNNFIENIGFNMIFDNLIIADELDDKIIGFYLYQDSDGNEFLYNPLSGVQIDRLIYMDMADCIRKINMIEKEKHKAGNDHMKEYLLTKERKRLKRLSKKKYEPYLEKMVVSLVNTSEFPYDYDGCMNLSIYRFNQSLQQIHHKISFDNTMIGVYAGTVDTSKMKDKNCLSWIANK